MGLGIVVLLAALGYIMIVDATSHYNADIQRNIVKYNNGNSYQLCFLYNESNLYGNATHLTFSPYTLVPYIVMVTISELLIFLTLLEFICAQAPRSMRSFLISISLFIHGVSAIAMSLFVLPFGAGFKNNLNHLKVSCGSIFFAFVISFGVFGFIVYYYIAKWYKDRQRGGQYNINYQTVIEGYYERMIEERQREEKQQLRNSQTSYFSL